MSIKFVSRKHLNIWFYAPLKAPGHPSPSGDRRVARLLERALQLAGHRVTVASSLRSFDRDGNARRQRRIRFKGKRVARRLIRHAQRLAHRDRPHLWLTYHLYHKAPDWLGPEIADALGIPYVVVEASFAPKQARGRWALGHRASRAAIASADAVAALNQDDIDCVAPLLKTDSVLTFLRPFLELTQRHGIDAVQARRLLAHRYKLDDKRTWLLTVAMMRFGDKLASFRVLAEALGKIAQLDWQLLVVGDGAAGVQVRELFEPLGSQVVFAGQLSGTELERCYASADLFVWPAVNEAFGMALLEAQSAGLAVVAGATGGVPGIVADGETGLLTDVGDATAFAQGVRSLLNDEPTRQCMGGAAAKRTLERHGLRAASHRLNHLLNQLV